MLLPVLLGLKKPQNTQSIFTKFSVSAVDIFLLNKGFEITFSKYPLEDLNKNDPKVPGRIKQALIYFAWGLLAMAIIFILMLVAALIGWGI